MKDWDDLGNRYKYTKIKIEHLLPEPSAGSL